MPLNAKLIANKIISRIDSESNIEVRLNGADSDTAIMLKIITEEIINAILAADVITQVVVATTGSATAQTGTGTGQGKVI